MPYFFDLISFRDNTDTFMPHVQGLPYRYNDLFEKQGRYLLTVMVSGDAVKPARLAIRVDCHGNRKAIIARARA